MLAGSGDAKGSSLPVGGRDGAVERGGGVRRVRGLQTKPST